MLSARNIQLLAISLLVFMITAISWPFILPALQTTVLPYLISLWTMLQPFMDARLGMILCLLTLTAAAGYIHDLYIEPMHSADFPASARPSVDGTSTGKQAGNPCQQTFELT